MLTAASYEIALPNKFFEAVAAAVPVVCSPLPEVVRLVKLYGLGEDCDPADPRAIAQAVLQVTQAESHDRFSANASKAREALNWEVEEKTLIDLYATILPLPAAEHDHAATATISSV